MKYISKTHTVEAWRMNTKNHGLLMQWANGKITQYDIDSSGAPFRMSLNNGYEYACVGDYIVKVIAATYKGAPVIVDDTPVRVYSHDEFHKAYSPLKSMEPAILEIQNSGWYAVKDQGIIAYVPMRRVEGLGCVEIPWDEVEKMLLKHFANRINKES